ncbi:ABC transporter permease [Sciscionella marina]|uniref:ABC transporter permease n=1 Tax=Sciscionella marina TaxID=508770 RepID=UPI00035DF305|nr:ABC transporter permease [Sciscionella marina]
MIKRYVLGRLAQGIIVLFGAVAISFLLTNVIGKPADVLGGDSLTPAQRAVLNAKLGYDRPMPERFLSFLEGVVTGDFGKSYRTDDSAIGLVLRALPNTLVLVLLAMALAVLIAVLLAIFSVRHRERRSDRLLRRVIGVLQGMPEFWLALMMILLFSVQLRLFPSFGFYSTSSLILPVVSLAIPMVPMLFRIVRGQLLDVLSGEFVDAMRARGLTERFILYRHVLPNTAGPSATFGALQLGHLIGGSLIVETIFSWPGIGNLTVSAVQARDFTVVQTVIIIVATFYVLLNLAADLIVLAADPRVRVGVS